MRIKKTIILFTSVIGLYLFYRIVLFQSKFFTLIIENKQTVCNSSRYIQRNTSGTRTSSRYNVCLKGELVYGNYCVITPYHQDGNDENGSPITLTTQGTIEFLHHVVVLCSRWSAPISVAVYCPPEDYSDVRRLVNTLRNCDFCIRRWVSWHFFFRIGPMPDYSGNELFTDCESIRTERSPSKRRSKGTYPINVGRNLARSKAMTHFVFPIDIELYPSPGIVSKFERMLRNIDISEGFHVWVFPVFEVYSKYNTPKTKTELRTMFVKRQAISFHRYRCNICHKIPNLTQWLNQEAFLKSEVNENLEALKIWTTVKRSKKYNLHIWEPFFIGTKQDPEFDIRLSWEGKQNKMQVAFEMCLMDYNFHIVENAFLVHAPGINVYNATKDRTREKHMVENNKWISIIRKDLIKKYGQNKDC